MNAIPSRYWDAVISGHRLWCIERAHGSRPNRTTHVGESFGEELRFLQLESRVGLIQQSSYAPNLVNMV